jgi:hypothetical protein
MQDLERLRATDPQLASEIEQFMRASGGTFGG